MSGARAVMDRVISEKAFQGQVEQLARQCGWLFYHTWRSDHSQPGFPDLVLIRGEQVLFRELKREGGTLSVAQERWRDALIAAGCDWRMWKPSDWPSIEMCLRRTGEGGG
jgi:hypothetical protein